MPSVPSTAERPLRRDASRNRARIIAAARRALDDGRELQFNEIARAAEVGIGTVYRHFASPEALREAAVLEHLEGMLQATGDPAGGDPAGGDPAGGDAWAALVAFIRVAVLMQRDDPALAAVVAQPADALARTGEVRRALVARFDDLVRDADAADALRPGIGTGDVSALICGTAYAVRVDRAVSGHDSTDRYLEVLLTGIRRHPEQGTPTR